MTTDVALSSLYRGKINLWVEDPLTRDYLRAAWNQDSSVAFFVAGGGGGVPSLVKDARLGGVANVFAYVDRDFRTSNRNRWSDPDWNSGVYISAVHEVENHLLDWDALAGCGLKPSPPTPEQLKLRAERYSRKLGWWTSCRAVLAEERDRLLAAEPSHPTIQQVGNEAEASAYLDGLPYWNAVQLQTAGWNPAARAAALRRFHATAAAQLQDGSWVREFPGKEIFHHVRSLVHEPRRDRSLPPQTAGDLDSDVAKAVGAWQAANEKVPAELIELLASLKRRVGL